MDMPEFVKNLVETSDFLPHGYCLLWQTPLVGLLIVSDALIALAYYSIPLALLSFARRRKDLAFHWMFLMFGGFIFACGTTHLVEIWTLWVPSYWLEGVVKLGTALVSVATAILLWPLIPRALALPSPVQLATANRELHHEIIERKRVEEETRKLNEELEQRVLERTAQLAATNEELRREIAERERVEKALRESEVRTRAIVNTAVDSIITIDAWGIIETVNPAAERLFGYSAEEMTGRNVKILMPSPYRDEHDEYIARYLRTGEAKIIGIGREVVGRRKDGTIFPLDLAVSEMRVGEKRMFTGIIRDISERKRVEEQLQTALREKETLLREIHHRVKNNLQVIYSLLDLQSEAIKDPAILTMFRESQNRVKSMALIHQLLYQSKDFTRVDFATYLQSLTEDLLALYRVNPDAVILTINANHVFLDINTAIPCGLIINELVSNALKHAFPDGREGEIRIDLQQDEAHQSLLRVCDNGVGFPEEVNFRNTASLGLQLVHLLTDQLGGTIEMQTGSGTCFEMRFAA
jgi:PAS domain S-box-containing protein